MKFLITTTSLLLGVLFQAKTQELTLGLNAAQAGTSYQLTNGKVQLKPSIGGELGLQIPMGRRLQFLTGVDFFSYKTKATLGDNKTYAHYQVDDMGSAFEYRVTTSTYSEQQSSATIRIPFILQILTGNIDKSHMYFNIGAKHVLPTKIKVSASASSLVTKGYYPDVNAEVHDLPQHGFGTVPNWKSSGEFRTKGGWIMSAGTGVSFKLKPNGKTRLYTGLFVDYGVTNLKAGTETQSVITYSSQNVSLVQANGTMGMTEASKLGLMNIGLQVKIGFGHKQKGSKTAKTIAVDQNVSTENSAATNKDAKGVVAGKDATAGASNEAPVAKSKTLSEADKNLLQQPVSFGEKNNVNLTASTISLLNKVAEILKKNPSVKVLVKGHSCNIGSDAVNERRSLERAVACADYLVKQGVPRVRVKTKAMSSAEPIFPNTSEENRMENRRVTIEIIE